MCVQVRRLRYVIHDQRPFESRSTSLLHHFVLLPIYVLFVFSTAALPVLKTVFSEGDQVLHKSNIISTNLTIRGE